MFLNKKNLRRKSKRIWNKVMDYTLSKRNSLIGHGVNNVCIGEITNAIYLQCGILDVIRETSEENCRLTWR